MFDLKGVRVTIVGLSKRTGLALVKFLASKGAIITVTDSKSCSDLREEINLLEKYQLRLDLGGHSEKSREADLIVVSPGVPFDIPFLQQARQEDIEVISEIELAYQFAEAKIIAITGTNGKTTTTALLAEMLADLPDRKVKVAGNIGIPMISEIEDLGPEDLLVTEVSSFQLEGIKEFKPSLALFLNFAPDHLDRHHNLENYWQAKMKIFANQTAADLAIINFDDEKLLKLKNQLKAKVFGISLREKSSVIINDDIMYLNIKGDLEELIKLSEIPLTGEHNLYNIAFAALAARLIGQKTKIIKKTISLFKPAGHRMESIKLSNRELVVIDDSKATNPAAAYQALASCQRPVVLIAGGQARGADFSELAPLIKEKVKLLILLGETKEQLAEEVLKTGFNNIHKVDSMKEAVFLSEQEINRGDCLLLSPACPSWDMYASYQARGAEFQKYVKEFFG